MTDKRDFPSPVCNLPTIGEGAEGNDVAESKNRWAGRPPEESGKMSFTLNFSVIAPNYSRTISCPTGTGPTIRKFIREALLELQPDQWLLAESVGEFPWSLMSELTDLPCATDEFEVGATALSEALDDSTLVESGFPQFDFEYSKLVFRDPAFSNGSSIGVLGWINKTPLLICEDDYDHSFGVVPLKPLASYEYFQDSTGAPVSWAGGARFMQVNTEKAISFSTGDSGSESEVWDWSLEGELDDDHAQVLVSWLDDYNLVPALAWSATQVGNTHSISNQEILQEIAQGETSGLSLSLNLTQKEFALVIEYCPRVSELFLPIRNMLSLNKDDLLRDLFISFGSSGLLFDGGRELEEDYNSYSASRRVIQQYYLLPGSPETDLPDLARTNAVIARLEDIQMLESMGEKIRILTGSDDHGLRIAGILISREKSEPAQNELMSNLVSAFRNWANWRDLEAFQSSPKQQFQDEGEAFDSEDED